MVKVNLFIQMETVMMVNGLMMRNKVMVFTNFIMEIFIKVVTKMEKNMVMEYIHFQMAKFMKVNLKMIILLIDLIIVIIFQL